jgi:hypothetical protein
MTALRATARRLDKCRVLDRANGSASLCRRTIGRRIVALDDRAEIHFVTRQYGMDRHLGTMLGQTLDVGVMKVRPDTLHYDLQLCRDHYHLFREGQGLIVGRLLVVGIPLDDADLHFR